MRRHGQDREDPRIRGHGVTIRLFLTPRTMVEAGKKAGANIVYVEVPGGTHSSVVAPNFGPMLEFFATQKKSASE